MPEATDDEFQRVVGVRRDSIDALCTFCERSFAADLNWRGGELTLEGIAAAKAWVDYIDVNFGESGEEAEDFGYDQMTCAQLKERLGDLGLKKSGLKSELVERLREADEVDRELAAAGVDGDDDAAAHEDTLAAIDDPGDDVVERIDWSNMTDDELQRMCELWRVKGRFTTRSRAIRMLEALHERGEGCLCKELAAGSACRCGWGVSGADATEDAAEDHVETVETAQTEVEEAATERMSVRPMPARKRNSRWFTLETAESHTINYHYLVDLWDYAVKHRWDIKLIKMLDQSTLELERYFGRVKQRSQGTPSVQQFMQADLKVRLKYALMRLDVSKRWVLGSRVRGNIGDLGSGLADPAGQAGDAVLGTLLRRSKSGPSRGRVPAAAVNRLEAEQAHAAAIRHEVKDDGLKQSLADTANKSSYNSGGACRLMMLPPGMYATFRDLAAPEPDALNGRRCAVYWKDKPRTEAQQKAGEKGRWWKATVTGVEKARNTLLLAVQYDAQYEVEPTADQLDVRTEHVVWLYDERGAAQ